MYICLYIYIFISVYIRDFLSFLGAKTQPDPTNDVEIFESQLLRFALWELVPNWYKTFLTDYIDNLEINSSRER